MKLIISILVLSFIALNGGMVYGEATDAQVMRYSKLEIKIEKFEQELESLREAQTAEEELAYKSYDAERASIMADYADQITDKEEDIEEAVLELEAFKAIIS